MQVIKGTIESIEIEDEEEVFDITVGGKDHNLFVDGVLVSNSHHINFSEKNIYNSYFTITMRCGNAYYRFGFTASPGSPNSNERKLLEMATGRVIDFVSVEDLTKDGYLVQGKVYMYKLNHPKAYKNVRQAKVEGIFRNTRRNSILRGTIQNVLKRGQSILIACTEIVEQGNVLEELIPEAITLYGNTKDSEERKRILDSFSSKENPVLISTLLNEGVDLPAMDCVFNASGQAKDKKTIQIAGRVLTICKGKKEAIIYDFYDIDGGLLEKWSKKRLKEYERLNFDIEIIDNQSENNLKSFLK